MNRVYLKKFIITSIITSLAACSLIAYSYYDYTTSTNTRYKIVNQENKVPPKNNNKNNQKSNVKIDAQTGASY